MKTLTNSLPGLYKKSNPNEKRKWGFSENKNNGGWKPEPRKPVMMTKKKDVKYIHETTIKNMNTGETLTFPRILQAAHHIGVNACSISNASSGGSLLKGVWSCMVVKKERV